MFPALLGTKLPYKNQGSSLLGGLAIPPLWVESFWAMHLLKAGAGDKVCLLKLRVVPNISWDCRVKGACPRVKNSLGLLRIQQCSFIKGSRGLVSDLKTREEGECGGGVGAKSAHPRFLHLSLPCPRLSCAPTSHPDSADNFYNSCSSHQKTRYKQTSIDSRERKASTQFFTREEAN